MGHIRLYDPTDARRPAGTRWLINGYPAAIELHPPSDEPPHPDAQLDPSGIWVTLRLA